MTQDEYDALLDNEHMVWCVGTHNRDGSSRAGIGWTWSGFRDHPQP
jgi:hypothetical protein